VVFGCGNPSRGDDALGPALMERVREWIRMHPDRKVEAVEDFQLQVEHTLDMEGRDLALFVDAAASGTDTVTLRQVAPSVNSSFSTHALSPEALLQAFMTLGYRAPPPAFSLAVRGHAFGLGQPPCRKAEGNLERAWVLLERLLEDPSEVAWEGLCTQRLSLSHYPHPY
jgi:hydrogenase maturation protease